MFTVLPGAAVRLPASSSSEPPTISAAPPATRTVPLLTRLPATSTPPGASVALPVAAWMTTLPAFCRVPGMVPVSTVRLSPAATVTVSAGPF